MGMIRETRVYNGGQQGCTNQTELININSYKYVSYKQDIINDNSHQKKKEKTVKPSGNRSRNIVNKQRLNNYFYFKMLVNRIKRFVLIRFT